MKKITIFLSFFSCFIAAMDKPASSSTGNKTKRKAIEAFGQSEMSKPLQNITNGDSKISNSHHTSPPLWDPISNIETITAYLHGRKVGHVTFSDNTSEERKSKYNSFLRPQGKVHELNVDAPRRYGRFNIEYDLLRQAILLLKSRGVAEIIIINQMDELDKNPFWRLEQHRIDYNILRIVYLVANKDSLPKFWYARESTYGTSLETQKKISIERHHIIRFLDRFAPSDKVRQEALFKGSQNQANRCPLIPSTPLTSAEKENPNKKDSLVSNRAFDREEQTVPMPVDFLKQYICEEKKSGASFPGKPELEFTIPVADDLYDNSFSIDLREAKTGRIAAQVTYGQELDQKDVGSIHYFYMKPAFFSKGLGYPFFKHAIDQLTKLGYKKITWQALVQKPEMTRAGLHENIKYFAHEMQKEGFSTQIDATSKEDFVTLQVMVPGHKESQ